MTLPTNFDETTVTEVGVDLHEGAIYARVVPNSTEADLFFMDGADNVDIVRQWFLRDENPLSRDLIIASGQVSIYEFLHGITHDESGLLRGEGVPSNKIHFRGAYLDTGNGNLWHSELGTGDWIIAKTLVNTWRVTRDTVVGTVLKYTNGELRFRPDDNSGDTILTADDEPSITIAAPPAESD